MINIHPTQVAKDMANKQLTVTREFSAPVAKVWRAWTRSEFLDQWWAPKPWKAITKTQDFRAGGFWLYAMTGPDGTAVWARVDYLSIEENQSFQAVDSFCDEHGNKTSEFPSMHWKNDFRATADGTQVVVLISFQSEADLEKILEMGFEQGFTAALTNLDELLEN